MWADAALAEGHSRCVGEPDQLGAEALPEHVRGSSAIRHRHDPLS
jgi:hypothetical protein